MIYLDYRFIQAIKIYFLPSAKHYKENDFYIMSGIYLR